MNYLKKNLLSTFHFLKETRSYFKNVFLLHSFILFLLIPFLLRVTRFIFQQGNIPYISSDNLGSLFAQHPITFILLFLILLFILLSVFFESTFLLLSVYFIRKKQAISLRMLLKGTLLQFKKLHWQTIPFFLFYYFLILPISGIDFHSSLLSKIKVPVFILDFIFANRVTMIALALVIYFILIYLAIRLIFALPEMILKNQTFQQAIQQSWQQTKHAVFKIFSRILFFNGSLLLLSGCSFAVILLTQAWIEQSLPAHALTSAVIAMMCLQLVFLMNMVFSAVGTFYLILDYMEEYHFLPDLPDWFAPIAPQKKRSSSQWKFLAFSLLAILFGAFVGKYNIDFLRHPSINKPLTISHRGVDNANGVQNTLAAFTLTAKESPDYIEMDVQETKDQQFVVMHDFNLKQLTGIDKRPNQLTLNELLALDVRENGMSAPICSFDAYLARAEALQQKLLIEIKATPQDSPDLIARFVAKYGARILKEGHILHSLTYQTVAELKEAEPRFYVGYILPFNLVGPPISKADFFTMEYSTLNQNFINAAHRDGKQVYAWTVNSETAMTRMMFYGVDGIVTDQMQRLKQVIAEDLYRPTYFDKLLHFFVSVE